MKTLSLLFSSLLLFALIGCGGSDGPGAELEGKLSDMIDLQKGITDQAGAEAAKDDLAARHKEIWNQFQLIMRDPALKAAFEKSGSAGRVKNLMEQMIQQNLRIGMLDPEAKKKLESLGTLDDETGGK